MAKRKTKKSRVPTKSRSKASVRSNEMKKRVFRIGVILVGLAAVYLLFFTREKRKYVLPSTAEKSRAEPQFKKEGELFFSHPGVDYPVKRIDIEIAEKPLERMQGLMYRSFMPDTAGMLFIFERARPQSFWMKDTYIPLDILFIGEEGEIVTIHRNTVPLSEESIPSYRNAKYVLEVNAGFCDRHGIGEGDVIQFRRIMDRNQ